MYPKLKVRSQDQDFRYGGGIINPSLLGLKALFLEEFRSSSKKESKPTPKKVEAQVPSSFNMGSITPSSASKDSNERGGEEDVRPHIRASSIPRPRAVLSSPDNDELIGSKAKRTIEERTSRLKPHQSGHKCNATMKPSSGGRPKTGREVSEKATNKSDLHNTRRLDPKCNVNPKHSTAGDNRENKGLVTAIRVKE